MTSWCLVMLSSLTVTMVEQFLALRAPGDAYLLSHSLPIGQYLLEFQPCIFSCRCELHRYFIMFSKFTSALHVPALLLLYLAQATQVSLDTVGSLTPYQQSRRYAMSMSIVQLRTAEPTLPAIKLAFSSVLPVGTPRSISFLSGIPVW
jgi:hypothetical protein